MQTDVNLMYIKSKPQFVEYSKHSGGIWFTAIKVMGLSKEVRTVFQLFQQIFSFFAEAYAVMDYMSLTIPFPRHCFHGEASVYAHFAYSAHATKPQALQRVSIATFPTTVASATDKTRLVHDCSRSESHSIYRINCRTKIVHRNHRCK